MIRHSWFGYALLSGALLVLMSEVCGELVSVKEEEPCVEQQEAQLAEQQDEEEVDENEMKRPESEATEVQETLRPEFEPEKTPEIEAVVGGHRMVKADESLQEVENPSQELENSSQEVLMSVGNAASVVVTDEYQIYKDGDKVEYLPLP